MIENCREMCILVRAIVDSARVGGRGCAVDAQLDCGPFCGCGRGNPCRCADFLSATAGPCVTLRQATVEPLRNGCGCCVRAEMSVPVTLLVCTGGCNATCTGEICLPVEGILRKSNGILPELVAQANVTIRQGCIQGGYARLWVDYTAEIYGICQRAVRIPVLGPCDAACDCLPFFNLPLYPRDKAAMC